VELLRWPYPARVRIAAGDDRTPRSQPGVTAYMLDAFRHDTGEALPAVPALGNARSAAPCSSIPPRMPATETPPSQGPIKLARPDMGARPREGILRGTPEVRTARHLNALISRDPRGWTTSCGNRLAAAYDWRRTHSATPQRNALTCRDGCAFMSGGDPHTQVAVGLKQFVILTGVTFGYRDSSTATAPCVGRAHPWPPASLVAWLNKGLWSLISARFRVAHLLSRGSCLATS
jgi:hypothetical protein